MKIPKLRSLPFETQIIERYRAGRVRRRRCTSREYVSGVWRALWDTRVSPSTVSELNKKLYALIDKCRNRPIKGEYPYVYLDSIRLKRTWGWPREERQLTMAVGVNSEGYHARYSE